MRTLSSLAVASQNAENTDEVWLIRLTLEHASIVPGGALRFVNNMVDIRSMPLTNLLSSTDISGWSGTAVLDYAGHWVRLNDNSAAAILNRTINKAGLTSGTTYCGAVRIQKDTVGKASRAPMFAMAGSNGSSKIWVDTATGESAIDSAGAGLVGWGVIDDGDGWLAWQTRTGSTAYDLTVYPADTLTTLGTDNVAAQGIAGFNAPRLWAGTTADLLQWIAFPFQIDLPGEDPDQASVSRLRIDNVDQSIIEAIRGLPSKPTVDLELILASHPDTVEIGFYDLSLRAVDYDAFYIEGQMTFEDITTEPITLEMTPSRFPGLF